MAISTQNASLLSISANFIIADQSLLLIVYSIPQ